VLVHTDGAKKGHCYALIRPNLGSQWYKFDNEQVTTKEFKGEEELYSNAYMLVYIRQSDREKILCTNDVDGIAQPLQARLKRKREEGEELTEVKVAREEDLRQQIGQNVYPNLVDHALVRSFRVQKNMPFSEFKVEMLRKSLKKGSTSVQLFLQATPPIPWPFAPVQGWNKDDVLLFVKLYDPMHSSIRYAGHLLVKPDNKPADVLERIKEMCGIAANENVLIFEERNFVMSVKCKRINRTTTFKELKLEESGILWVQKALTAAQKSGLKHPDVPSFLEFVQTQQVVHLRRLEQPREDAFCLLLSKQDTYDKVVERLAEKLGLAEATKIRFTMHNCYSLQPKLTPIKYRGAKSLGDMLAHDDQASSILYFETLDVPLPELEKLSTLVTLDIVFHGSKANKVSMHRIQLDRQFTVADVLAQLKAKVELSHPEVQLRLLGVFPDKICQILPHTDKIESIDTQMWAIHAEEPHSLETTTMAGQSSHSSQSSQVAVMVVAALALVAAGYYVGSTGLAAAPSSLLDSFARSNKAAADALTVAAQEEEEAAVAAAEEEILSEEEALDAPDPRAAVNESDPAVLRVIAERRRRREAARQKYKEELLAMVNEVKQAAAAPGGLKEEETVADVSNVPLQYGATEISQLGEVVGKGGGGEKGGRADVKGVTGAEQSLREQWRKAKGERGDEKGKAEAGKKGGNLAKEETRSVLSDDDSRTAHGARRVGVLYGPAGLGAGAADQEAAIRSCQAEGAAGGTAAGGGGNGSGACEASGGGDGAAEAAARWH
ncbi:unnamed protein product, partial [Closterium sp. Naga37s-1]